MSILWWLLFGALVGWVASLIMHTDAEQGPIANIVVGIIGAVIGGGLSSMLNGPGVTGFDLRSLFVSVLGAVILLFFVRLISRGRHESV